MAPIFPICLCIDLSFQTSYSYSMLLSVILGQGGNFGNTEEVGEAELKWGKCREENLDL